MPAVVCPCGLLSPSAAPALTLPVVLPPQRPYEIHSATPVDEVLHVFKVERVHYSSTWGTGMVALLKQVRCCHRASWRELASWGPGNTAGALICIQGHQAAGQWSPGSGSKAVGSFTPPQAPDT